MGLLSYLVVFSNLMDPESEAQFFDGIESIDEVKGP